MYLFIARVPLNIAQVPLHIAHIARVAAIAIPGFTDVCHHHHPLSLYQTRTGLQTLGQHLI